jgi:uroporphyrinogen-III synthase
MLTDSLSNRVIAVPEARELDLFAQLLERRGARVWRCPLVAIVDAADPQPVREWLRMFTANGCDDLVLLTGEGLRRLLACIERHDPDQRDAFLVALGQVRRITRGPKPARALRLLGLTPDIEAETPTTQGVISTLRNHDLRGRRIGVQLYGSEPNLPLIEFLTTAGATPLVVAPYAYADAAADTAVTALLVGMAAGEVDAIAFTSKAQVARLFKVGPESLVRAALGVTQVAVVGPVIAEALTEHGITVHAMPQASWFMKPLATELAALFSAGVSDTSAAETQ